MDWYKELRLKSPFDGQVQREGNRVLDGLMRRIKVAECTRWIDTRFKVEESIPHKWVNYLYNCTAEE